MTETSAVQTSEQPTPTSDPVVQSPAEQLPVETQTSEVTDLKSYTQRIKDRAEALRAGSTETPSDKPRDDKGRFQASAPAAAEEAAEEAEESTEEQSAEAEEAPAEEPEAGAQAEEAEAAPSLEAAPEQPKQTKLEELKKKIEAERARRVADIANKRRLEELDKAQPVLQGLQQDKLGTILKMVTPQEWEQLCDMQIARLQGKDTEQKAKQVEDRLAQKLTEIEKREQQIAIQENQRNYGRSVETLISKDPSFPKVKRWLDEHRYDIGAESVDFANTVLEKHKYIPTYEQARDEIIAYVLGEIEISKRVDEGEQAKPEAAPTSKPPAAVKTKTPRRTLNSTLRGSASRPPEIQIRGKETFAEHIKARVAAMKK